MSIKLAAVAGACVVLAGCAQAPVDDRPVVRIVEAAQPTPAIPLGRYLPTAQELSAALGTGPNGLTGQLIEGDAGMLLRNVGAAETTPPDCLGAAYRSSRRCTAAPRCGRWRPIPGPAGGFDGPPVTGFFGVVQMTSPGAAQEFFATMTDRWRRCNGQTVARTPGDRGGAELSRITAVSFDQRVVAASVLHTSAGSESPTGQRAIGVAGDCIVEVELTDPRAPGEAQPAVGVADLILDKIAPPR